MGRPRATGLTVLLSLVLCGMSCARPQPLLFCHNANCRQPTSASSDDTLAALEDSLALRWQGRPVIDGMELDLTWNGSANGGAGRCDFAHGIADTAPSAEDAAQVITDYLSREPVTSWNRQWFHVQLELKGQVSAEGASHTARQAVDHVTCALDFIDQVEIAAAGRTAVEFVIDSGSGDLLATTIAHPRWQAKVGGAATRYRLAMDFLEPTPISFAGQSLADFPPVTDVVFHPNWITDGQWQAIRSMGLDVTLWMSVGTEVTLGAIRRFEPRAVVTSDILFLRRWEED
jgi:hypothetical protein